MAQKKIHNRVTTRALLDYTEGLLSRLERHRAALLGSESDLKIGLCTIDCDYLEAIACLTEIQAYLARRWGNTNRRRPPKSNNLQSATTAQEPSP